MTGFSIFYRTRTARPPYFLVSLIIWEVDQVRRLISTVLIAAAVAVPSAASARGGGASTIYGSVSLGKAYSRAAWTQKAGFGHFWDQSAGDASADYDGYKEVLEAVSICNPGASSNRSDARATYRWTAGKGGIAVIHPVGQFWGQLISLPTAGEGGGEAKITMVITDITSGEKLANDTIYKEETPAFFEDLVAKGDTMEKRETGTDLDLSDTIAMQSGHTYEAEIKLWTSCWSKLAYGTRVDFSRHTISRDPDKPLIGMLLVRRLSITYSGVED
jgi:hypothetical protein